MNRFFEIDESLKGILTDRLLFNKTYSKYIKQVDKLPEDAVPVTKLGKWKVEGYWFSKSIRRLYWIIEDYVLKLEPNTRTQYIIVDKDGFAHPVSHNRIMKQLVYINN